MSSSINEKIAIFRKSHGYTQEEFGKILNLQRSTYAYKETSGIFTANEIATICKHFDLPTDYFEEKNLGMNIDNSNSGGYQLFNASPINFSFSEDESSVMLTEREKKIYRRLRALDYDKQKEAYEALLEVIDKFDNV